MIIAEKQRSIEFDGKGQVGTVVLLCDWDDIDPLPRSWLPTAGDAWITAAGQQYPLLRCVSASGERMIEQPYLGLWTAHYSTAGEITEEFFELSTEVGMEPGPELTGWVYDDTKTPVIDIPAPPVAVATVTIKMKRASVDYAVIMDSINCINDRDFLGYPAKTVLFLGATTDNQYSVVDGSLMSSAVVYKFSVKSQPHNLFWRPPMQALDVDFNPIFWQNLDDEQPFYTSEFAKVGTPVWIHETDGQSENPAGIGGWTEIVDDDSKDYFRAIDMALALDIAG